MATTLFSCSSSASLSLSELQPLPFLPPPSPSAYNRPLFLKVTKINKELNEKRKLATSETNMARAYSVTFGTCKFPENFTGCQDFGKVKVDVSFFLGTRLGGGLQILSKLQGKFSVQGRDPILHAVNVSSVRQDFLAAPQLFHAPKRCRTSFMCLRVVNSAISGGTQESGWEREEARWLREEQRWLREEVRWLREEARWNAERNALVEQATILSNEIKALKLEIKLLRSQAVEEDKKDSTLADLIVSLTGLLESLNKVSTAEPPGSQISAQAQIPSATSSSTNFRGVLKDIPMQSSGESFRFVVPVDILSSANSSAASSIKQTGPEIGKKTSDLVSKKGFPVYGSVVKATKGSSITNTNRRTLKKGAEGEDVKQMQEALSRLGFHSGEDDIEYSIFSSGTESAVKTWQATTGLVEDGIVTAQLLAKLLGEESPTISAREKSVGASASITPSKGGTNVALNTSVSTSNKGMTVKQATETQGPVKESSSGVEVSQRRVYLLGENRWEEPSRLTSKIGNSPAVQKSVAGKCFACGGQGKTLCTECEGTGELNVEEQFLDWVEEGAKCPYCEGSGAILCDVCVGKGIRDASVNP